MKYDTDLIYREIVNYKLEHDGNSPSIRELLRLIGANSTSHMLRMIQSLEKQGYLVTTGKKSGYIEVVGGQWLPPG